MVSKVIDSMMSPERRFGCHIPGCGKRFKRKFTLQEHLNTHTGARPYVCDYEGCKRCFSTHGNLNRHKFIHTGEKPFGCTTCQKRFCTKEKLVRHVKTHANNSMRSYVRKVELEDDGNHSDSSNSSVENQPMQYTFDENFMTSNIHDEILLALQTLEVENNNMTQMDMLNLWADDTNVIKKPEEVPIFQEPFTSANWSFEDMNQEDPYAIKGDNAWFIPEPFQQMV
ncbi:hypothetical protein THRCLA_09715 [Thraustotheca clavata]|uniref:C2H2-type domain-containing protein n=1 Tax=Thraustotheca clavata TaxID=74557 RepID=A0A1V9YV02_9STRA|nr:hypothetical protein THRCLA_09715 [Thraustotheca clavata]